MIKHSVSPLAHAPVAARMGGTAVLRLELAVSTVVLALVLAGLVVVIGLPGVSVIWAGALSMRDGRAAPQALAG